MHKLRFVLVILLFFGLVLPGAARYEIPDVVDAVSPSVVSVSTTTDVTPRSPIPRGGVGSGVIVSEDGMVITNYHVIQNASRIVVTLTDGTLFEGVEVLGVDQLSDIAVLQLREVEGTQLPAADLGDSDAVRVGETVLAFGNPFAFQLGDQLTVTKGIISAKNRVIETDQAVFQDFLQTDAAINPGNSGGPLVTVDGRVIGINTAIIPYAQGIGFAIPINTAQDIMQQLLEAGRVVRPWLGAQLAALPRDDERQGVVVRRVEQGSQAASAGLRVGDVIVEVNRTAVRQPRDVFTAVEGLEIGERVVIEVLRNGSRRYLVTEIEERP